MSTKHIRTTGDVVRFGCALLVECTHCHNTRTFDAKAVLLAFGNWPLKGIAQRCRCTRCGFKQARARVLNPL